MLAQYTWSLGFQPQHHIVDPVQVQARWGPRAEKGEWAPPLAKMLFTIDTCQQRENQCSSMEHHWEHQPHFWADPVSGSSWPRQSGLHDFFVYFFVGFLFSLGICFGLLLFVCFDFRFQVCVCVF